MRNLDDVANQFAYHPATKDTAKVHDNLRSSFMGLLEDVWPLVPDGPEKTIMARKVQEGLMYANLAVALQSPVDREHSGVARVLPSVEE